MFALLTCPPPSVLSPIRNVVFALVPTPPFVINCGYNAPLAISALLILALSALIVVVNNLVSSAMLFKLAAPAPTMVSEFKVLTAY